MKKQLKLGPALSAVALAAATGSAMAGPIVTNWSYSTNAEFVSGTFGSGGGSQVQPPANVYELSWGATGGNFQTPGADADNNRSALTIGKDAGANRTGGGPVTGNVDTTIGGGLPSGNQIGLGVTFSHWNNPISGNFATLTGGRVKDTLTLTPLLPSSGPVQNLPNIFFDFVFSETTNDPPGNPGCAGGTAEPCGDLFGIVGFNNFNQSFGYDGNTYFASIFVLGPNGNPSPVATLLPAQCAAIGLATGCQGFLTAESAVTTAQFAFSITTDRFPINVPEPASLALAGLALLGAAGVTRRRRRG